MSDNMEGKDGMWEEIKELPKGLRTGTTYHGQGTMYFDEQGQHYYVSYLGVVMKYVPYKEGGNPGNPGEKPSRLELIRRIKPILPSAQLNMSGDLLRGEEGEHFEKVFLRLAQTFEAMPQPYQTEGTPTNDKIIHLHYFTSGSDWYIIERDSGQEQIQAFGYVILNQDLQNAEWGYVNLEEMKGFPQVELDFHWTPKTFKEVMIVKNPGAINSDNPGNPGPDNELQFKAPLARAEQFMNELRRMGFDVGHDADYEDPENYMTVIVRDVPPGKTRLLLDVAQNYVAFQKHYDAADNLRDRLIAEIYDNRLNAWKQGHVGIKPVSDDDLTELRGMATQELEQTAQLTRQFLIPIVPGPRTEIERFEREEAGGFFTLIIYSDRTWDLYTPEGVAKGKYDDQGESYGARHQHPIIRDWINEKGREFFGPPSVRQPGETLYAVPIQVTQVTDHIYYVLAKDPGEALQKAKDDDYVDIWHVPQVEPLPPSAYRWGTPIVATEGERIQYLSKR